MKIPREPLPDANEEIQLFMHKRISELEAEVARLTAENRKITERANIEAQLACDLRSTQDAVIERCAKAVEEWPEAAIRLRTHCGLKDAENYAVSGEDFGQMRREVVRLREICREIEEHQHMSCTESECEGIKPTFEDAFTGAVHGVAMALGKIYGHRCCAEIARKAREK